MGMIATGCGATTTGDGGDESSADVEEGFTIGLLLPDEHTARYEAFDYPYFEEAVGDLCPACEVNYQNAAQDTDRQQSQVEAMLTEGIEVMVLDAVDAAGAGTMVQQAKDQGVPVVAYDRLAEGGVDTYVSFDNVRVGEVQGEALLERLEEDDSVDDGQVVVMHGSPTDPNASNFKEGALSVLADAVDIGQEYDTPEWSPDQAQEQMDAAITAIGADDIVGVYAANDGLAGGAIAALQSGGVTDLPPVTGQDAELAGIQRIVAEEQYMTVYKAIRPEADTAAEMAVALATGEEYSGEHEMTEVEDGEGNAVQAVLLDPIPVTLDNVMDTVVEDGFYTVEDICADAYADTDFCAENG
ncbi:substrate-binding domain-containing protein [Spiractinospora alimapuensis]|uniref:sugar ABC transporter substrate-binding protein n=1 Tax=Spiractinospora alimapuensis TaxID=2820884 RepID=UPI001F243107|nr:substrate-binding domain-containing protein [Spiractinospora alimapuensis]QVQ52402.1 substrate-binding domain-containing protein [Spiractinospora alimapuensis]